MSNIYDIEVYRKRREAAELRDNAQELLDLLDSLMIDGEQFLISVEDENGNRELIDLDEILGPSDSNPYEK